MAAMARGEDDRPVETEHEDAKSYSQQETFATDIGDFATIDPSPTVDFESARIFGAADPSAILSNPFRFMR